MNDLRPQVWTSHSKCHGNNISYAQALRCLANVAVKQKALIGQQQRGKLVKFLTKTTWFKSSNGTISEDIYEDISVLEATNRICAQHILSPCSTPARDTSAMDGFAVPSALTVTASVATPVKFRVAGIMAAGADIYHNRSLEAIWRSPPICDHPCVEIMTGACFPEQQFPQLDAVVKVEDVELVEDRAPNGEITVRYILVSAPTRKSQHRRPAGSDFRFGDLIIEKGAQVQPKHIMALASVGINSIVVMANPKFRTKLKDAEARLDLKIGILSTGSELHNIFDPVSGTLNENGDKQRMPDSNGPYITSALEMMSSSSRIDYIGPCSDDENTLVEAINKAVESKRYNILVTSGGVSMGRFDLIEKVMETHFDAEIIFHGCLVRPGAPLLFGVINQRSNNHTEKHYGMTAVIGAPGNPMAAAMTVRFFLKPFLTMLQSPESLSVDELIHMSLSDSSMVKIRIVGQNKMRKKTIKAVAFLLAKDQKLEDTDEQTDLATELLEDQASYKISPFLQANCWIAAPAGEDKVLDGDQTLSYSLW